jgi:hypothetical protein
VEAVSTVEADLGLSSLVLDVVNRRVRGLDEQIASAITDGSVERTVEGASSLTLTVHDADRALLRSGVFGYAIDVMLDKLYFRLVKVSKQANDLSLTFEDRAVALLRQHTSPKKANRAKVTRAEFALSLVREVHAFGGIPFVCPELHTQQKVAIATSAQGVTPATRAATRGQGLNRNANLTVQGKPATLGQMKLAERVLDVANSLDAGQKATVALMEACIVESGIQNLGYGDRDSLGILQVRSSTAQGMGIDNRDPAQCANTFLTRGFYTDPQLGGGGAIALSRSHPEATAGRIAQACQGSAYPSRYDQVGAEATAFVAAYSGAGVAATTASVTKTLPYQFQRGGSGGTKEDSWTCLQRLASEVQWRCFVSAGTVYFISETELLKAKPRLILDEDTDGVLGIDFDIDTGKPISEVTITARADRWAAGPGVVVELTDRMGLAQGRYLVATINRGLFDATATITCRKPMQPLPEPAAQTSSVTVSTKASTTQGSLAGSTVDKAYAAAEAITGKHYPYVWGGGHAHAGVPDHGQGSPTIGYDCSGAVSAVLASAGMGLQLLGPAMDSTALTSWGDPGQGEHITVWARPGVTTGHAFIIFGPGVGKPQPQHFGTGDWGKGWSGAGLNPELHPTAGFTPRHWPGT